jgi:required for meiotic nuclear division protein 1
MKPKCKVQPKASCLRRCYSRKAGFTHIDMVSVIAYQVAESILIKKFRSEYEGDLIHATSFDLFYRFKEGYIYVLNYGVVVFANVEEIDRTNFILLIKEFCINQLEKRYKEDFLILISNVTSPVFSYNALTVPTVNDKLISITMLHVAQSAALDYYHEKAQKLMDDTVVLTTRLEKYGKLKIGKKALLKFIGKAMNTKNKIIDDLYVIDSPAVVWEDELMGKVNDGLSKTFDIHIRFRELEYILRIVENNLSIFIELTNARESHRLEWIIIILIFIEVLHMMFNVIL